MMTLIPTICAASLTFLGSVFLWLLNERGKRRQEVYLRREERYAILIESVEGFYENTSKPAMKATFITQLNLCWMYCPDDVIRKGYEFLATVSTDGDFDNSEKEKALGEFILAIRQDLINNRIRRETNLTAKEFKFYRPNNANNASDRKDSTD